MKVAVIGLGIMGMKHYSVLKNLNNITSVISVDLYTNKADYRDVDTMLNNEKIDFAIIATPTSNHKNTSLKLLSNGVDVLIEKPISLNTIDAHDIIQCAEKNTKKVAVGYIERFNSEVQNLIEKLGKEPIINCNVTRLSSYPTRVNDVGVKLDLSIHDIDLIRFITQQEITSWKCNEKKSQGVYEDSVSFLFELSRGATGIVFNSWMSPRIKRNIEVLTESNYYSVDLLKCTGNALEEEIKAFIKYIKYGDQGQLCCMQDAIEAIKYVEEKI